MFQIHEFSFNKTILYNSYHLRKITIHNHFYDHSSTNPRISLYFRISLPLSLIEHLFSNFPSILFYFLYRFLIRLSCFSQNFQCKMIHLDIKFFLFLPKSYWPNRLSKSLHSPMISFQNHAFFLPSKNPCK